MSDGKSLKKSGVAPDEPFPPAGHRRANLKIQSSHTLPELAGNKLTPRKRR